MPVGGAGGEYLLVISQLTSASAATVTVDPVSVPAGVQLHDPAV